MKALLLCLFLIGCATVSNHFKEARSTTVMVSTAGGHGSGNIINNNCIVTAEHVIHGATTATVTTSDEKTYLLAVTKADEGRDVAYLCSSQKLNGTAIVFGKQPETYSHVFTIGFPFGTKWYLTEGMYQGDDFISAECAPGNSGGGVFNDEGKYIGMVDSITLYKGSVYTHICLIIPASEVMAFLEI